MDTTGSMATFDDAMVGDVELPVVVDRTFPDDNNCSCRHCTDFICFIFISAMASRSACRTLSFCSWKFNSTHAVVVLLSAFLFGFTSRCECGCN